jgi:hypothetical protein
MPSATDAIGEQLIATGAPSLKRANDSDRGLVLYGLDAADAALGQVVEDDLVVGDRHTGFGDRGEADSALFVGVLLGADPK